MSDLPKRIDIVEEGPREGFQIERDPIPTARKIALIDALSQTGVKHIQVVSFVNPKRVPGMADAEAVVSGIKRVSGVSYSALWFNERGLQQALAAGFLEVEGKITLQPSDAFLQSNLNRTPEQHIATIHALIKTCKAIGVPVCRASIGTAFGCNFQGAIPTETILRLVGEILDIAAEHDLKMETISLADTMAWGTPESVKRTIGAVRNKYPDVKLALHLHDTRGLGIANAYAGLEMGIDRFDSSVGGLGGCPFAKHAGAAGNVATEDLVFLCEEMGIATGIDLEAMIEAAALAESVVGHPVPGCVGKGGSLSGIRKRLAAAA